MVIPPPRRSRRSAACPHTAPTATARWSSIRVATPSLSSVSTRMVFLLHGEDSFRTRLGLGELVAALLSGAPSGATDLSTFADPHLGSLLGVTRHDAGHDTPGAIMWPSLAQGRLHVLVRPGVLYVDQAEVH